MPNKEQLVPNNSTARHQGEFLADKPLEALKADHHFIQKLFSQYFRTKMSEEKKELGPHILLLLEMHTALEEGVLYPRVQQAAPSLVYHCDMEHEHARNLIEKIKLMDESDPQTNALFHQLADVIFHHMELEEEQLFPLILQANLDLAAIGNEMQAFENSIIAYPAQHPAAPGMLQQSTMGGR